MVARLTPDQKFVCSNHVEVKAFFSASLSFSFAVYDCPTLIPLCVTGREPNSRKQKIKKLSIEGEPWPTLWRPVFSEF